MRSSVVLYLLCVLLTVTNQIISLSCPCLQVEPQKYKNIIYGMRLTIKEDGLRGLAKGWAPTFVGYSFQGLGKFGFYEIFKVVYSNMLGEVCM